MATKRQIALAYAQERGTEAYNRGEARNYNFDAAFCSALKGYSPKMSILMRKRWYKGWDVANINNPNDLDNGQLKD